VLRPRPTGVRSAPPAVKAEPFRYTDADGRTWRVIDVVYGVPPARPGRTVRLSIGDPRATTRVFVAEDEVHASGPRFFRIAHLDEQRDRDTDPETLAKQLARCSWRDPRPPAEVLGRHGAGAGRTGG